MRAPRKEAFHVKRALLATIRIYQREFRPPSPNAAATSRVASSYAVESIGRFGVVAEPLLAAWRLLRCNPFSHGGFDPVPERFTLKVGPVDPAVHHGEAHT